MRYFLLNYLAQRTSTVSLLSLPLTGQSSSLQHSVLQEVVVVGSGVGVVGLMQFPSSLQTYPA